jgi:hypothetical protein
MDPNRCLSPDDEISSCNSLLDQLLNRVFLILMAVLTTILNDATFILRLREYISEKGSTFTVFVLNLCLSDFVMGVYLAIICVADSVYRDSYLWEEQSWRHSVACQVAGFLALVSCEVSAFNICLITLDRFLAVKFPFGHHFERKTAS